MDDGRLQGQVSLQYDEFSDLLGGAVWDEAFHQWCRSGLSSGRRQNLPTLASRFSSPNQFLFSEDRQRYPLEVFWLKWNLFIGLCRRIQSIHQENQRPFLNLQPAHLPVQLSESTEDFLPARWVFSLDTSHLQLADRFAPPTMPADARAQLFSPPPDAHPLYTAPLLRQQGIEQRETATVLIRSMERMRASGGNEIRAIVQAQLVSEQLRSSDYSQGDLFLITLSLPEAEAEPVRIWAGKRASAERGILLDGTIEPVSPPVWGQFEKAKQKVFARAEVVIYKSLHLPCDLYSLGMILFRGLLVNERQDLATVHKVITRTAENLGPILPSLEDRDRKPLLRRLRFLFQKEGAALSKEALLYRPSDNAGESIPDDLWIEALLIGFRLLRNQAEYDPNEPGTFMERIAAEGAHLSDRIKMELFGSRRRNREILEACDLIRKELSEVRNG
ncbi:MAG: hypothetical protein EPO39_08395 [Candidatus Manganitrophaceae bacterium]|nr:MAG: hypothetical protein EPO39_08395 [Candidatus Manganitrophaceae bacterium]